MFLFSKLIPVTTHLCVAIAGLMLGWYVSVRHGTDAVSFYDAVSKETISVNLEWGSEGMSGHINPATLGILFNQEPPKIDAQGDFTLTQNTGQLAIFNDQLELTLQLSNEQSDQTLCSEDKAGEPHQNNPAASTEPYVASTRGSKYHQSDSSSGKSITAENRVYFNNKEEAEAAGYEPGASVQ